MIKRILYTACLIFVAVVLSSCASIPSKPVFQPPPSVPPPPVVTTDIIHFVAPGETLWRIGKMYDVPINRIMQANRLKDPGALDMGRALMIPNASHPKPVISLYANKKWKYLIVHHSATEAGNSLAFHKHHLKRGWDRGVGYHFVIDNGTSKKRDGQIEVTPRWLKQQNGAHCKASSMNTKAIGICLVGNFNKEFISRKQMDSLVFLVRQLMTYYKIPFNNIIGHGKVPEASTECPGRNFPWEEFKSRLYNQR